MLVLIASFAFVTATAGETNTTIIAIFSLYQTQIASTWQDSVSMICFLCFESRHASVAD